MKSSEILCVIVLPSICMKVMWDELWLILNLSKGFQKFSQAEPFLIDWGFGEATKEFVQQ